jgi:hypothetical protein
MALPWQADFLLCSNDWWPIASPDDVVPEESVLAMQKLTNHGHGSPMTQFDKYPEMVGEWSKLAFV